MAVVPRASSRRLVIKDSETNCKLDFLIDTGADISVIPIQDKSNVQKSKLTILAANTVHPLLRTARNY